MKKAVVNKLIDDFKEEIESWIKVVSKRSFKDGYIKGYKDGQNRQEPKHP